MQTYNLNLESNRTAQITAYVRLVNVSTNEITITSQCPHSAAHNTLILINEQVAMELN